MRDLERKAQAARDVYELFVNRSRDTGEIQEVAPVRTKVISVAAPPKQRSFPPSATALAAMGFVGGLALGFLTRAGARSEGRFRGPRLSQKSLRFARQRARTFRPLDGSAPGAARADPSRAAAG